MSKTLDIVTAVIRDEDGRWLLVRKQGSNIFMKPGGKREAGEDDLTALTRELREELGCTLMSAEPLGVFQAPAANEPQTTVHANVYLAVVAGAPVTGAEIAELAWLDPQTTDRPLARLLTEHVVPAVRTLKTDKAETSRP